MSVTTHRRWVALLGFAILALIPVATPAHAFSSCGRGVPAGGLAQLPGGRPLADPIPHIPINGTAGFTVGGANTLPGGELSIGLGYLGQQAVCQQEEGVFDQNLVALDRIPDLLGPARHRGFGYGFPKGGGHDVGHGVFRSCLSLLVREGFGEEGFEFLVVAAHLTRRG